jgi:hypothetical protein
VGGASDGLAAVTVLEKSRDQSRQHERALKPTPKRVESHAEVRRCVVAAIMNWGAGISQ